MRALNHIQISPGELRLITHSLKAKAPCQFLVFGLGNDSSFWHELNPGGCTVFLEDNAAWFERVLQRDARLDARLVSYWTKRTQWRELLHSDRLSDFSLPEDVRNSLWDVILIDAPAGWRDSKPGRMLSIAAASRLAAPTADIFVHDCHREVEQVYSSHLLGDSNLVASVRRLRQYRGRAANA